MAKKVFGAGKRFGARYGKKLRDKFAKVEAEHRRRHKCPYCMSLAVKRSAVGIWKCRKCLSTFTGKAYTIPNKIIIKQEFGKEDVVQVTAEEPVVEKEEKPQKYKEKKDKEQDKDQEEVQIG